MKFSLRLNNDLPVSEYIKLAQAAEAAGFDQFWVSNDLFLRSAAVILTAAAAATQRIQIGCGIFNPYSIHPAELAMFAATLDEFSSGRFLLGLSSGAGDFLKWIGIEQEKPRTAVIEAIDAINRLLCGERVPYEGEFLHWTGDAYMRFPVKRRIPIYIGALGPAMLREIGRVADGGLPLLFPPEHYANVLPLIKAGAAEMRRDLDEIDVAACIWVSVSENRAAAEDVLKEKIAYYGHALSPLIYDQLGLTRADFTPIEQAIMTENNLEKAKALITPQMMRIGIAGNADDLNARLETLAALGVKHISFGPPLGPDPLEAIRVIGQRVIPHFKAL